MKIHLIILLLMVSLFGCKGKKQQTEADPPKGEVSPKADSNSAETNIVQQVKADSNAVESNVAKSPIVKPNISAKVEQKQVIATVNSVGILKSDYEARVEQQINPVQRQMPAAFFEQY